MKIIPLIEPYFDFREYFYLTDCLRSSWVSSGKYVTEFEDRFAEYCDCKYGVATTNGTSALHLALRALNIVEGDEVIIPNLTFMATANAVSYLGAKPVPVDIEIDSFNISPELIEKAITNKTKAIMPVHLYGNPCNMDSINRIAKKNGLYVVEDSAEAHGALYKGRKTGSLGDIGCFSFFGNKTITTGEGGMCVTNDSSLAEKMRVLRDYGRNPLKRYSQDVVGYNYRMTNLQGALGCAQLSKIEKFIYCKRRNAEIYNNNLNHIKIQLPIEYVWSRNIYWLYSIRILDVDIESVKKEMFENGIDTREFFCPINKLPPYFEEGDFRISEEIERTGLSLPSSVTLDERTIKYISETLLKIIGD